MRWEDCDVIEARKADEADALELAAQRAKWPRPRVREQLHWSLIDGRLIGEFHFHGGGATDGNRE